MEIKNVDRVEVVMTRAEFDAIDEALRVAQALDGQFTGAWADWNIDE